MIYEFEVWKFKVLKCLQKTSGIYVLKRKLIEFDVLKFKILKV